MDAEMMLAFRRARVTHKSAWHMRGNASELLPNPHTTSTNTGGTNVVILSTYRAVVR